MSVFGPVFDAAVGTVVGSGVTMSVRSLRLKPKMQQNQEELKALIASSNASLGARIDAASTELRQEIRSTSADLGSRIDGTNARLDAMDASLGSRIDAANARLDQIGMAVGSHEGRITALERAQV